MDADLFDISVVIDRFKNAAASENDVLLDLYIEAFNEILKYLPKNYQKKLIKLLTEKILFQVL